MCPVRALTDWLDAASVVEGPVFRRIWSPPMAVPDGPPPLPTVGSDALTSRSIARSVQARASAAGGQPQAADLVHSPAPGLHLT